MKTICYPLAAVAALSLVFQSCKPDECLDCIPHEHEEVITSLVITAVDSATGDTSVWAFRDPDGAGGAGPSEFDTILLDTGHTYNVVLSVLNESESPAEDVTSEILAEADEHLFCYTATGAAVSVNRIDSDGQHAVGIMSVWRAGKTVANGTLTVELKHQPGVKDGTCAPGDTDIQVVFPTSLR